MIVVITGPIASGKSTIALELGRELERSGRRVTVIDLDLVHEALDASPPNGPARWSLARERAAAMTNAFLEAGVDVVIAEGSFNQPRDRQAFTRLLRAEAEPLFVTLTVTFEEALRRAQGDPTRGRSRDRAFLEATFAPNRGLFAALPAGDLVIDTERTPPTDAAMTIARRMARA
jgi:adenylylsulfate kinase-like enzyme